MSKSPSQIEPIEFCWVHFFPASSLHRVLISHFPLRASCISWLGGLGRTFGFMSGGNNADDSPFWELGGRTEIRGSMAFVCYHGARPSSLRLDLPLIIMMCSTRHRQRQDRQTPILQMSLEMPRSLASCHGVSTPGPITDSRCDLTRRARMPHGWPECQGHVVRQSAAQTIAEASRFSGPSCPVRSCRP